MTNGSRFGMGVLLCTLSLGCAQAENEAERVPHEPGAAVAQSAALKRDVFRSSWNGASANVSFSAPGAYGYLEAWENRSQGSSSAYLSYSIERFDPDSLICETYCVPWYCGGGDDDAGVPAPDAGGGSCPDGCGYEYCYYEQISYEYGWGEIPAGDFQGNAQAARLATDLSSNPGFYVERCTRSNGSYNCTIGAASESAIGVRWRADGQLSEFQSGITKRSWGPYSYSSQGSWRQASAAVNGSIGLIDLDGVSTSGSLSQNQGGSVTKTIGNDGGGEADGGVGGMTGGAGTGSAGTGVAGSGSGNGRH